MAGHATAFIPAGSSAPVEFGTIGSEWVAIINQANNPQTSAIAVYDAPSYAAYAAAPTKYQLIWKPLLDTGTYKDMTVAGRGIRLNFGGVAIPLGPMLPDGGATILFD